MPIRAIHRRVANIALQAAGRYGVALAGGNALLAHQIIDRYTDDVDLFVPQEGTGFRAAARRRGGRAAAGWLRLAIDDVIASKVGALVTRSEIRDYLDVAAILDGRTAAEVIALARQLQPDLEDDEFAVAGDSLDRIDDLAFARYGPNMAAWVRSRFTDWPRTGLTG